MTDQLIDWSICDPERLHCSGVFRIWLLRKLCGEFRGGSFVRPALLSGLLMKYSVIRSEPKPLINTLWSADQRGALVFRDQEMDRRRYLILKMKIWNTSPLLGPGFRSETQWGEPERSDPLRPELVCRLVQMCWSVGPRVRGGWRFLLRYGLNKTSSLRSERPQELMRVKPCSCSRARWHIWTAGTWTWDLHH